MRAILTDMSWQRVAAASAVPIGSVIEVKVDGEELAVCNVQGEVRVVGGICPHAGGPLGYGTLDGECVVCPYHAWGFSTTTGQWDGNPTTKVPVYAAKVEDGSIFVNLAERRA